MLGLRRGGENRASERGRAVLTLASIANNSKLTSSVSIIYNRSDSLCWHGGDHTRRMTASRIFGARRMNHRTLFFSVIIPFMCYHQL